MNSSAYFQGRINVVDQLTQSCGQISLWKLYENFKKCDKTCCSSPFITKIKSFITRRTCSADPNNFYVSMYILCIFSLPQLITIHIHMRRLQMNLNKSTRTRLCAVSVLHILLCCALFGAVSRPHGAHASPPVNHITRSLPLGASHL